MSKLSSEELKYIKKKLIDKGYKLTEQRETILNVIVENKIRHLSIDEIYELVKITLPDIGIATVYRTIVLLKKLDLLCEVDLGDGFARYEIVYLDKERYHPHLICSSCGKIIEVKDSLLELVEFTIEKESNFKIVTRNIVFYGLCNECDNNKILSG